jgi:lipid A ethanolaminephosphotransferase
MEMIRKLFRQPPQWSQERLVAVVALYCVAAGNASWWSAAAAGRAATAFGTWLFLGATALALVALHYLLLVLPATRWTVRPWLSFVVIATGSAAHFIGTYHVLLDATMLRNVLRTDTREAGELISVSMLARVLLWALPALLLIWWVRLRDRSWRQAALRRTATLVGALAVAIIALLPVSRDFMSMMRNQRDLRYLVTPGNLIVGLLNVGAADARVARREREVVGADARRGTAATDRPKVLVLVIGETARAASFQLDGYARATTPQLAKLDIVNFSQVQACGTSTEVSLPCMFSRWGREDYDEDRIRSAEGFLHVAARAGYDVIWLENQSGCKGACEGDGIRQLTLDARDAPAECPNGACRDMALVRALQKELSAIQRDALIVLHMIGNHGPAYFERYPEEFRRFTPDCHSAELRRCSRAEVVNAFDNDILYTDHVLASTIRLLQADAARTDSALLYVSDHGESLGESGLYLHGMPYAIAPDTQTHVPMIYWQSQSFADRVGVDAQCLRTRSSLPHSHDNLFHSVLGVLDIETTARLPQRDLFAPCRGQAAVMFAGTRGRPDKPADGRGRGR